jgi:general secretion pathway protein D
VHKERELPPNRAQTASDPNAWDLGRPDFKDSALFEQTSGATSLPPVIENRSSAFSNPMDKGVRESVASIELPAEGGVSPADLIEGVAFDLVSLHDYRETDSPAQEIDSPSMMSRRSFERQARVGERHVIHLEAWGSIGNSTRLVIRGHALTETGQVYANPDVAMARRLLRDRVAQSVNISVPLRELERRVVRVSYIDAESAIEVLGSLGVGLIPELSQMPPEFALSQLPMVAHLPEPTAEEIGLVGNTELETGEFGSAIVPTLASDLHPQVNTAAFDRILVYFHPDWPEQFGQVEELLQEFVDVPARQIFVEAMVVEIASIGLEELGVDWEFEDGKFGVIGGVLRPDVLGITDPDTLFGVGDSEISNPLRWRVRLRALVRDGKAEILSRPSVLALNNRQASIRIGQEVPIATSQEGLSGGSSKIAFDFKYIALGILLNIRPRVSADGEEISLMVDAVVSDSIPEADLVIRDSKGAELARAPRVDTRRVQTYARVKNNMPFIIGGLVSRDETFVEDKVPLLGNIPWLGRAFRSTVSRRVRREIIIVITPYVVPESPHLSRGMPSDSPALDAGDTQLFRRTYRIHATDIGDVRFLYNNRRFQTSREAAHRAIADDYRLAEVEPFSSFTNGRLPGARIIVNRILRNFAVRHELYSSLHPSSVFVVGRSPSGDYYPLPLNQLLSAEGTAPGTYFDTNPESAIIISFLDPVEAVGSAEMLDDPVPRITTVPCADRAEWSRLLWEYNQPTAEGRSRSSIVIHRPEDLRSLGTALVIKHVLELNGGRGPGATYSTFLPGRILEVPNLSPDGTHHIDAAVARHFFQSSPHFYTATVIEIEDQLALLESELRRLGYGAPRNSNKN